MSVFSFLNDNFSKYQWIFTKHFVCIDIVEAWFGIADGQISSIFVLICYAHINVFPQKARWWGCEGCAGD